MAKRDLKKLFRGKDTVAEELKEAKAIKSGKISPMQYAKGEKMEKPEMKKFAKGGDISGDPKMETGQSQVNTGSARYQKAMESKAKTGKYDPADVKAGEKYVDDSKVKKDFPDYKPALKNGGTVKTKCYAAGGSVSKGDGCATKGRTKGRMV